MRMSERGPLPWTGAPCSPWRTPGFPVEFPGVDELHAAFLTESRTRIRRWRPVQEIRDHGPKKTGRSPFERFYSARKAASAGRAVVHGAKALEEHRFRPMYAEANMGHPSRTIGCDYEGTFHGFPLQPKFESRP